MNKNGIEHDVIKLGGGIEAFEEWTLNQNKKVKRYDLRCTECGKSKKKDDIMEVKYKDQEFKVCGDCLWKFVVQLTKELNDGTLICEEKK